jgi:CRP/FNR family transcriptional regulator, cyclic AMP receptor protein
MKVAEQLTHNCQCAYEEIRSLGLSNSVPEQLAKMILGWAENPLLIASNKPGEIPIRVTLTQEEIAELAGTSRETVSRALNHFKRKGWLRVKGATWWITNKPEMEKLVTT